MEVMYNGWKPEMGNLQLAVYELEAARALDTVGRFYCSKACLCRNHNFTHLSYVGVPL